MKRIEIANDRGLCASAPWHYQLVRLVHKEESHLPARTWAGAQESLSGNTGHRMPTHDFVYGKKTTTTPKTISSMFVCT